jgi:hypothetical protein
VSSEWGFVTAAYTITWAVVIGYAAYVERRWRAAKRANAGGTA